MERFRITVKNPAPDPHEVSLVLSRGESAVIGRGESADVIIPNRFISRRHIQFEYNDELIVNDLGSRNGSRINGARLIEKTPIIPGDCIQISNVTILCEIYDGSNKPDVVPPFTAPENAVEGLIFNSSNLGETCAMSRTMLRREISPSAHRTRERVTDTQIRRARSVPRRIGVALAAAFLLTAFL